MENKIGEIHITNQGYKIEIIEYFSYNNCTIRFEDGNVYKNKHYWQIKTGAIDNPKRHVGERHKTNEGYFVEIVDCNGIMNCKVVFENTSTLIENLEYYAVKDGRIKNPYHKSVLGVGYYGDTISKKNKMNMRIEKRRLWANILIRCYDEKIQKKQPTYKGTTVCEEWHNFQNFAEWYEHNYNPETMQSWHIDKDILVKGNKVYSPTTCCFVPLEINILFTKRQNKRGDLPIGVSKNGKKFVASFTKGKKQIHLGTFTTPEEAFQVYKTAKEEYIKEVADKWRGQITDQVYQALYNYQVEITD